MVGTTDWIAVDWGTSNLRLWGMDSAGNTTFSGNSDKGMGKISRADYPAVLAETVGPNLPGDATAIPTIICGMAGARQGWVEAPYLATPARLADLVSAGARPTDAGARFAPIILPGVAQRTAGHEDVMRGEEVQLLGLLGITPGFEGTAVLPGTHSKWVDIRDGRITRFETAMTGELFDVLATHAVLRHSLNGDRNGPANAEGFSEGLEAAARRPHAITSLFFRTRAASLLSDKGSDWCAGYLSGLLIGAEIAAHLDWIGGPLPLIGSAGLCARYQLALRRLGHESHPIDATDATLAGLKQAWRHTNG